MDPLNMYRQAVERVLTVYTTIPYAHGELRCEALFDREHDRYERGDQPVWSAVNAGAARGVVSRLRKPFIGGPGFSTLPAMEIGLETLAAEVGKVLCKSSTIRGLAHKEGIRCLWK